jgi:iron-sulfur cluster repair protein YtfE (RIC family)
MDKPTLAIKLKKQLLQFLKELSLQLPKEGDIILAIIILENQIPEQSIVDYFITKIIPLKDEIMNKNEKFFLENNILFESIENSTVNKFKTIWQSNDITNENREIIWDWFKIFVMITEKYMRV